MADSRSRWGRRSAIVRAGSGEESPMPAQPQPVNSHPTAHGTETQLRDIRKGLPLRVLSAADWEHWTSMGYVIVRQVVPVANVERLVDLLWAFDGKDPDDPSTWYVPQRREHKMKELNNTG